ncbi:hypothetical protein Tco_0602816, partial [Tanacetum coccineum]
GPTSSLGKESLTKLPQRAFPSDKCRWGYLSPATSVAGDTFPQRHVAGERPDNLPGKVIGSVK